MSNDYCSIVRVPVPSLEEVRDHPEANTFSLLIVALLERGGPMTLAEVAGRFEEAGVAPADAALRSLQRCRPGRPPVYRDGDLYALDPHDDELDLWTFRLGLRPPMVPRLSVVRPEPPPLPGPEVPVSGAELEEAFRDAYLFSGWSAQRLALAVLDAHGPAAGGEVVATLNRLTSSHGLTEESAGHWRRNAPIRVAADGTWSVDPRHPALVSARLAVRQRIESRRRQREGRPDPSVIAAVSRRAEERREAHAAELAGLRRALLHVFPRKAPEAAVLVDVNERRLTTYMRDELGDLRARLAEYDLIGAVDVRGVLRALDFHPGERHLVDLGPPQKSRKLNRAGRRLKITLELLVRGSCGISRPFADPKRLREYLDGGELTRFRRRLEADAKSLFAIYQYGRLHGVVRLRWGFLDEWLPVPWKHIDEPSLRSLIRDAHRQGRMVEVVAGSAPGWADPWSRARRCSVAKVREYDFALFDELGLVIDEAEVQLARLAPP